MRLCQEKSFKKERGGDHRPVIKSSGAVTPLPEVCLMEYPFGLAGLVAISVGYQTSLLCLIIPYSEGFVKPLFQLLSVIFLHQLNILNITDIWGNVKSLSRKKRDKGITISVFGGP